MTVADPIQRRGEWWQERPGGGWLRWSETSEQWEPQELPPPPPDQNPATEPAREESAATLHDGESAPAPTPGYKYEQNQEGVWWARNERTGQLYFHDAAAAEWRKYRPHAAMAAAVPRDRSGYAGFWERFAAAIIDGVIVTTGSYALGYVIGTIGINQYSTQEEVDTAVAFAALAGFVAQWVYFAVMESSPKQATLGKMAVGVRVTDMQGRRVGFGKATGRYFAKILSTLILLIGFLMVAWTPQKQGLHDQMAGTLVPKGRP